MKKYSIVSLIVLVAAFVMTSCMSNKGTDLITTQNLNAYFNVVTDQNTGQTMTYGEVSYKVNYNYTQATADITINGLKTQALTYPSLNVTNVKWKSADQKWKTISISDVQTTGGSYGNAPYFSNFHFNVLDYVVGDYYMPGVKIDFVVNNQYKVESFPTAYLFTGTTEVVSGSNTYKPVDEDEAVYGVAVTPSTGKATMSIQGAKFANQMPATNMRFKDIPFNVENGCIVMRAPAAFTPYTVSSTGVETPYEKAQIDNYICTIDPAKGVVVEYDCTIFGTTYHNTTAFAY